MSTETAGSKKEAFPGERPGKPRGGNSVSDILMCKTPEEG